MCVRVRMCVKFVRFFSIIWVSTTGALAQQRGGEKYVHRVLPKIAQQVTVTVLCHTPVTVTPLYHTEIAVTLLSHTPVTVTVLSQTPVTVTH